MKCQILFSGKNKKNVVNLSPAELAQRVVKVKLILLAPNLTLTFDTATHNCSVHKGVS